MKKAIVILLALVCLTATSFAGNETEESIYARIEMSDNLEIIQARFGEGIKEGDYYLFGDALTAFFDSGRIRAKSLAYDDIHTVAALTTADFALVRDFKQGTAQDQLFKFLGKGREIMTINLSDKDNAGVRTLYAWKNEAGGILEALFELDGVDWILFALGEIL